MTNSLKTLTLRLLHIDRVRLDSNWQYDKVISPFSRLYLITAGEAWVFHNNRKYLLTPGHLYLIPSFTYSRYHCEGMMEQYFVHFLDEMATGVSVYETVSFHYECEATNLDYVLMERLLTLNPTLTLAKSDPKTYDNRAELLSFNQPSSNQRLDKAVESEGILLQLFSRFFAPDQSGNAQRTKSIRQLGGVLDYIHTHLDEKLTVEQLAANQHLNVDYFSRHFAELMGVRPVEYITNKRLERAQLLVTTTNTSLKEIADRVGIPNIYYFSRLFRRRFGLPPGKYRETAWQV